MPRDRRFLRPLLATFLAVALVFAISACGYSRTPKDVAEGQTVKSASSNTRGLLRHQTLTTTKMRPSSSDSSTPLPAQDYHGVFSRSKMRQGRPQAASIPADQPTPNTRSSEPFRPRHLRPAAGGKVEGEHRSRCRDSPSTGPIQGSSALFMLPPRLKQPTADPFDSRARRAAKVLLDL